MHWSWLLTLWQSKKKRKLAQDFHIMTCHRCQKESLAKRRRLREKINASMLFVPAVLSDAHEGVSTESFAASASLQHSIVFFFFRRAATAHGESSKYMYCSGARCKLLFEKHKKRRCIRQDHANLCIRCEKGLLNTKIRDTNTSFVRRRVNLKRKTNLCNGYLCKQATSGKTRNKIIPKSSMRGYCDRYFGYHCPDLPHPRRKPRSPRPRRGPLCNQRAANDWPRGETRYGKLCTDCHRHAHDTCTPGRGRKLPSGATKRTRASVIDRKNHTYNDDACSQHMLARSKNGIFDRKCKFCTAWLFGKECSKISGQDVAEQCSLCCGNGCARHVPKIQTPNVSRQLLVSEINASSGSERYDFRQNTRRYNAAMCFVSFASDGEGRELSERQETTPHPERDRV